MSTASSLPAQQAPAERESEQTIRQQADYFSGLIVLRQMLDAMPEPSAVLNKNRQAIYVYRALPQAFNASDRPSVLGLRPGELLGCMHADERGGG